jgi:hypothetical protein
MSEPIDIRLRIAGKIIRIHIEDATAPGPPGERSHSPDYRSVSWDGRTYRLTAMQAAVVRMLWEAWEAGTPDVGQHTLLEAADSCADRLRDVFRHCQAWGTLVVPGGSKGTFRLNEE